MLWILDDVGGLFCLKFQESVVVFGVYQVMCGEMRVCGACCGNFIFCCLSSKVERLVEWCGLILLRVGGTI